MSKFNSFPIRRALISTYDKTGLIEFAQSLHQFKIEILSTGGTATLLREQGIPVIDVSEYTQFPEIMDGRVKTLHPKIHGGLLGRPDLDDTVMAAHDIPPIDLVVVNLYPFEEVAYRHNTPLKTAIENIDVGGPTMIRAAAKNYARVTCVVSPADYPAVIKELSEHHGEVRTEMRFALAKKAFSLTAKYDAVISNYLGSLDINDLPKNLPDTYSFQFTKKQDLRYGENPHQQAAFYIETPTPESTIASARQIQGKELSYNNIADSAAALECVREFDPSIPTCCIVKHANPCGVAQAPTLKQAYERAYQTDPTSSFGGIIAVNKELDEETVSQILNNQFVEVIIAPGASPEALKILRTKPNIRLLATEKWFLEDHYRLDYKRIPGGLLVQVADIEPLLSSLTPVTEKQIPAGNTTLREDMIFGFHVVKFVKSNGIVFVKDKKTLGIGAGQMSRIDSVRIATQKAADAKLDLTGSILASDAFFPFPDSIEYAARLGISAIVQPGGSVRDDEVIEAANRAGIIMAFTGLRRFRH